MSTFNNGFIQSGDGNLAEPVHVGRPGQQVVFSNVAPAESYLAKYPTIESVPANFNGTVDIVTPTYMATVKGDGTTKYTTGVGAIANRPSAAVFGHGTWQDELVISKSDSVEWTPSNNQPKLKIINKLAPIQREFGIPEMSSDWGAAGITKFESGGSTSTISTVTTANDTVTIAALLGGRVWNAITPVATEMIVGHKYVFTIDITLNSGSTTKGISYFGGTEYIPIAASGRHAMYFTYTAAGSIRMGSGLSANAIAGEVCNFTATKPMIFDVTNTSDLFYDWVKRHTATDNYPGNTIGAGNIVTQAVGREYEFTTRKLNQIYVTGDSFTNDVTDFPQYLGQNSPYAVWCNGYSGKQLSAEISSNYSTNINANPYDAAVIEGGINDIFANTPLATIKAALVSMCDANDVLKIPTFVLNVTPNAAFVATPSQLSAWQDWNLWLDKFCAKRGYRLIDQRTLFADPVYPYRMAAQYVSGSYTGGTALPYQYTGEVTHPIASAQVLLAALVKDALDKYMAVPSFNGSVLNN